MSELFENLRLLCEEIHDTVKRLRLRENDAVLLLTLYSCALQSSVTFSLVTCSMQMNKKKLGRSKYEKSARAVKVTLLSLSNLVSLSSHVFL